MYDKCTYISSVPPQIQIPQVSENICKKQSELSFSQVSQTMVKHSPKGTIYQQKAEVFREAVL